ncbi:MAG: GIY-YIG nuclease family protein [Patescibacteria group bacterium]
MPFVAVKRSGRVKSYYIYIMASRRKGTLYIGVTNDLIRRIWQHKNKVIDGFTKDYNVSLLVYYEETADIKSAIKREKQLKSWNRQWKIELIEKTNPDWHDLYREIAGSSGITLESTADPEDDRGVIP